MSIDGVNIFRVEAVCGVELKIGIDRYDVKLRYIVRR
jgi:hypothetical protein